MNGTQFYLQTLIPQWGIFTGIVLITIGYVDKKGLWTKFGWITLIMTSLAALYFNFFGELNMLNESNAPTSNTSLLISTGWQTAVGGVLAFFSLMMFHFKKKRYPLLAILTLAYFILTFLLYLQISGTPEVKNKTELNTEQKK